MRFYYIRLISALTENFIKNTKNILKLTKNTPFFSPLTKTQNNPHKTKSTNNTNLSRNKSSFKSKLPDKNKIPTYIMNIKLVQQ